jgi:predicted DNA-binding transcriptional regulator AlpA
MKKDSPRTRRLGAKLLGSTAGVPVARQPAVTGELVHPQLTQTTIDPLLDDHDLEQLTGSKRSSWQKKRLTGDGPPFIRIGRLVRYRRSEVEAWLAAIPSLRSTTAAGER